MLRFFYNSSYKYTNRQIIDISEDNNFKDIDYANIDSPDTINGHIIYQLEVAESIPTYILDLDSFKRWFISGITQLRTGKYQISLLRDIISENPELWKSERAYISSGYATDYNKYKRWNLPFTNTKINEQRLPINGKSSFFVFYVNTQDLSGSLLNEKDLEIGYVSIPGITGFDYEVNTLDEIPGFDYVGAGNINLWTRHRAEVRTRMDTGNGFFGAFQGRQYQWEYDSFSVSNPFYSSGPDNVGETNEVFIPTTYWKVEDNENNSKNDFSTAITNYITAKENSYGTTISQAQYDNLNKNYINKIIYNRADSKVYTIKLRQSLEIEYDQAGGTESGNLLSAIRSINFPKATNTSRSIEAVGNWVAFRSERVICSYTLQELGTATTFNFNFKANTRKLPKSSVRCVNIVSDSKHSDEEIAQCLMLAQTNALNINEDTGKILDIQYLPFSIATTQNSNFKINTTDNLIAEFIENDDLSYFTDLPDLENINKETDTIKIVSPSRASQYLFRPYDNGGNMEFAIKITLKPFTSIIYVRPSTQGLLQRDWDDKDCLVIAEDFSLTTVNSEWANYIYNNRTYQSVFDRQIQGREFERTWERKIEQAQARSDEWTARNISTQKARTYTGNLPIISDIAGATATAFRDTAYMQAAQLDREYNEALYQEGLSLSQDLFTMQLENIQSQPNIPSKITTIDAKFLDGVYLEFYSTNDTELQAIYNFYYYNGNRIDCYGTFDRYWGWFIRGKIIISNYYTQPEIDELNRRLSMGIFTGENYNGN